MIPGYYVYCLVTWIAVKAATIAGDPKPWVIKEKWVRCLWILSSRIMVGLVLQSGDLSWFNKSISSFVTNLDREMLWSVKFWDLILPTWWPAAILSACIVPQCAPLSQIRTPPLVWPGTLTHRHNQSPWPSVSPPLQQKKTLQNKLNISAKNVRGVLLDQSYRVMIQCHLN